MNDKWMTISELSKRSGVASSAIRYYEEEGLLTSSRTMGGHRQFPQDVLRRIAFIRVAQNIGLSLGDIKLAISTLPQQRTPNQRDWERLSKSWQPMLQKKIDNLVALRDQLSSCIGCGCLSLKRCALYNPEDCARNYGTGPRYLLGDHSDDVLESRSNSINTNG